MPAHSGKFAVLNGQTTVRNWNVNELNESKPYVASNTKGGTGRVVGVRDWNGSFGAYGGQPSLFPGDAFSFSGFLAADDDTEAGTGQVLTGTAIIDSIAITWNWATAEIISYVANFSGNGALVSSIANLSDATQPVVPILALAKVDRWIGPLDTDFEEWTEVEQVVLTISAANQSYVNSGSVVAGVLWRQRLAGIIDFTLALTEHKTLRAALPDLSDDERLKLFISASEFWELKWCHIDNFSGIVADRETGAIIKRTNNMSMNGFDGVITGFIKHPDLTTKWPV